MDPTRCPIQVVQIPLQLILVILFLTFRDIHVIFLFQNHLPMQHRLPKSFTFLRRYKMKNALSRTFLVSALLLAAGVSFPATSPAAEMKNSKMMMGHQPKKEITGPIDFYMNNKETLKLSDNQIRKLAAIKRDYVKTRGMEMSRIHDLRMGRMSLLNHYRVDMTKTKLNTDAILMHQKILLHAAASMTSRANQILSLRQYGLAKTLKGRAMMKTGHMMAPHSMNHPSM